MHWIINAGLKREPSFPILLDQLAIREIPYTLVRKPPLVGYLIAMHDYLDENGEHKPIMLDPIDGPVFVLGTTSMKAVSEAHGWSLGFIEAPTTQECTAHWGGNILADPQTPGPYQKHGSWLLRLCRSGRNIGASSSMGAS